ncbi:MAG: O-antigen ligase family protein [Salinivirgaceae bacterium]|nr:O-antigen ligase family protein [Salinivirgaceae bacterium]
MNQIARLMHSVFGKPLMVFSLMIIAIGLPISPFLVSAGQMLLALNYLLEGDVKYKIHQLKSNKVIWLFLLLPLIHVIWLANTSDFAYALSDLKIKVPLVVFPIIIGTSRSLSLKQLQWVLLTFVFGVFCGSVVSVSILTGIYPLDYLDIRDISIFISHIRFGLMLVFSLVIISFYTIKNWLTISKTDKIGIGLILTWFLLFLIILQSLTSWVVMMFLGLSLFVIYYKRIKNILIRKTLLIILASVMIFWVSIVCVVFFNFYFKPSVDLSKLPKYTQQGNLYVNDLRSKEKENGNRVFIQICYDELKTEWGKVSEYDMMGKDKKGNSLRYTLIRYLTSKGLTKDSVGMSKLDQIDINLIESGYASIVHRNKFIPYIKIYELVWEIDNYLRADNANKKSVAQRFEYLKAGIFIIKNNFLFGVGTGDLQNEFNNGYEKLDSNLLNKYQHRAHNQYLTFFITFGIIGFVLSLLSLFGPAYKSLTKLNILLISFLLIVFTSMMNEDTLETQAGVTFYIMFYTILLFSNKKK